MHDCITCGHAEDEHERGGECLIEDCGCLLFEPGEYEDGYHVIGHNILAFWEEQSPGHHWIDRATRDIKLLVGFLDAEVGIKAQMMEALIAQGKEGND